MEPTDTSIKLNAQSTELFMPAIVAKQQTDAEFTKNHKLICAVLDIDPLIYSNVDFDAATGVVTLNRVEAVPSEFVE